MTEQEAKAIKWVENIRDNAIVTLDHIEKEEQNVSQLNINEIYLIESLTKDILNMLHIKIPMKDQDVEKIIRLFGGDISIDPDSYFTYVKKYGKDSFIVLEPLYKNRESYRSFSLCRELGHLFLHMGYLINKKVWENNEIKNTKNLYHLTLNQIYQANYFAVALLMPKDIYIKIIIENTIDGQVSISKVADFFHLPVELVYKRGKDLNLLH